MINSHILWAIDTLNDKGYKVKSTIPEIVLNTHWSEVCRFITDQGFFYLKKVPPALSLEANVIKILHQKFHAQVPLIIADSPDLCCFLMHDAGMSLHEFFKQSFQPQLFVQAIQGYVETQISVVSHIDLFLSQGVPDWRLAQLPSLYRGLIVQEKLLMDDGLTQEELIILESMEVKLSSVCEQLAHYRIPETFGHCDFHDKNILVNTKTYETTVIDLGEVAITHPFFSLWNCLYRVKEHFLLSDTIYQQLQEACLHRWLDFESKEHLNEILVIIQQCWSIHSVLGEYRLIQSVDQVSPQALHRQGRLANNLRYWLKQNG